MPRRIILIAEDDEDALRSWARDIQEFNEKSTTVDFVPIFARTKLDALIQIADRRLDCAVVDLRLPEDSTDKSGADSKPTGNAVLAELLSRTGIPAVVYSGHPDEASDWVKASKTIRRLEKIGGRPSQILNDFAAMEILMSAMEHTQRKIGEESSKLFYHAIWPRWSTAWESVSDPAELATIVTRQIVSQVAEALSGSPAVHHPEEVYLIPSLQGDRINTGDMVDIEEGTYVVLTPRCNLANGTYPNNIMLALCTSPIPKWAEAKVGLSGNSDARKKAASLIKDFATQGHSLNSHFLPPCGLDGPWLVDFKDVLTVPSARVAELIAMRKRSIAAFFVPNLVQRYAAYIGRIGQPDLDVMLLRDQCLRAPNNAAEMAPAATQR